jgi:dolichol-phosphate mannosyltransferase
MFNEEENVDCFFKTISTIVEQLEAEYRFEIVVTDNCSTDATFEKLMVWARKDARIKVLRFSKNYGYQKSILTGYLQASGDAMIQLDSDLQDPPELIGEFLAKWREGNRVVYGIRRTRQEGWIIHQFRRIFYRLVNFLSEEDLPLDVGDFRLIDRCIVDALGRMEDAQPYLRGTIAAMGFKQVGIPYDRRARARGESHFSLSDLLNLALDGILNHSVMPLRLASFFGIAVSLVTLLAGLGYVATRIFLNVEWPAGFTTLAALTLMGMSVNALFLGIIGEYLGRIYKQVKRKPIVLIEHTFQLTQEHHNGKDSEGPI